MKVSMEQMNFSRDEVIRSLRMRTDETFSTNAYHALYPVPVLSRLWKIIRHRILFRPYYSDKDVAQLRLLGERATALRQSME